MNSAPREGKESNSKVSSGNPSYRKWNVRETDLRQFGLRDGKKLSTEMSHLISSSTQIPVISLSNSYTGINFSKKLWSDVSTQVKNTSQNGNCVIILIT